jgi:transcriptional regulator with XRE-family HTH domain
MKREKLITARYGKGWSQEELAEIVDVARNTVSAWERGIADPYPVHVQRLCEVFARSAKDLDLVTGDKEIASNSVQLQGFSSELGGNHVYMLLRRQFLQQIFSMTGNAFSLSALTQIVGIHPHQIESSNNSEFLPVFHKMGLFLNEKYPVAENIARRGFYIPSGLALSPEQIEVAGAAVKKILS